MNTNNNLYKPNVALVPVLGLMMMTPGHLKCFVSSHDFLLTYMFERIKFISLGIIQYLIVPISVSLFPGIH